MNKELRNKLKSTYYLVFHSDVFVFVKGSNGCYYNIHNIIDFINSDDDLRNIYDDEYWLFKNQMIHDLEYRGLVIYNHLGRRGKELYDDLYDNMLEIGLRHSYISEFEIYAYFILDFFHDMLSSYIMRQQQLLRKYLLLLPVELEDIIISFILF